MSKLKKFLLMFLTGLKILRIVRWPCGALETSRVHPVVLDPVTRANFSVFIKFLMFAYRNLTAHHFTLNVTRTLACEYF